MKKYGKYKDSGIEWIGEIPEHWKAIPMRFLLRERITDGPHETPTFLSEGIPFLSVDGIQEGELVFEGCRKISEEDHEKYKGKCIVEKNDILMGKAASVGKVAQVKVDFEFSIWSPLALLKPDHNKITSSYFEYFLKSTYAKDNTNILSTFNTQQNISMTDIPRIYYIIPESIDEQTTIANYLDRKTAELDELIADKKHLLELYEEEKTAIINQAVTKGLNPNAPMKDSGIEWLGEIPEHWEVKRFDFHFSFSRGLPITKIDLQDTGVPCVSYGEIHSKYGFEVIPETCQLKCVKEEYYETSKKSLLSYGDFIFADTSEDIKGSGNFTYLNSDVPTFAGYHTIIAKPKISFESRYIAYFFNSLDFRNQIRSKVSGTKVYSITQAILKFTNVVFPPIDEQLKIIDFLETKCSRIDTKKSNTEQLIELLTEYRTALISEVVTGKIKVTE